jgi:transposase
LLQAFFTVRSERQLLEQIDYNLLFRWFVGLSIDDAIWDPSVFSKNRDRLLEADVAREFLAAPKRDRFERRVLAVALAPSEPAGAAETARARVA